MDKCTSINNHTNSVRLDRQRIDHTQSVRHRHYYQMSVLDRVKMFLPKMKEANEELTKQIEALGQHSVAIDNNLLHSDDDRADKDETDNNSVSSGSDSGDESNEGHLLEKKQVIELKFALGDFTDSIIANIEENSSDDENLSLDMASKKPKITPIDSSDLST